MTPQDDYEKFVKMASDPLKRPMSDSGIAKAQVAATLALAAAVRSLARGEEK